MDSSELYRRADTVIPRLKADAYEKDEKNRTVVLTDAGVEAVEDILRGDVGLKRVDGVDAGLISLHPPVVGGAEKLAGERADHANSCLCRYLRCEP